MNGRNGVSGRGSPPSVIGGAAPSEFHGARSTVESERGLDRGNGAKMSAVVSGSRARSTWLTGTAGLLILVAAFVMMVCAAPRAHAVRPGPVTRDQLASWVWVAPQTSGSFAGAGDRGPVPHILP